MNYEYTEPFLEIDFPTGNKVQIKKSAITDIYTYKSDNDGQWKVRISFERGKSSDYYTFGGTKEEFDKNSRIVYL
jgi:hypothetical protein